MKGHRQSNLCFWHLSGNLLISEPLKAPGIPHLLPPLLLLQGLRHGPNVCKGRGIFSLRELHTKLKPHFWHLQSLPGEEAQPA